MGAALALGPLGLAVRAGLRRWGGKPAVTRWQGPVRLGLMAGLMAAPALAGAVAGGLAAVTATVLGLALLLLAQDLAWRWLPLEWSLPVLLLGLFAGFLGETSVNSLSGAALGAGLLWGLQAVFRQARGVEALGTGDIWLAAGIGSFAGPTTTAWVLALAALTGLAGELLQNRLEKAPRRRRWGVAYGSHMILVFLIIWSL